ncbi:MULTISPECIES: acyl carrier protein [Methylobacterium]|uniref:acyl carrier protein n=1 Tax=Methylobacterium TaxID=407 RepID=UPI001FE19257|nr:MULTISPECIES: acyl carrier protein [Methylobacterium]MDR7035764.1 acyl carrier protein [Methylobacterium sp. BE186]
MLVQTNAVREAILDFIAGRNPGLAPGAVTGQTSLVTSDALDSIGVLDLVLDLGERFGVEIEEEAFGLQNFESVDALARYIAGKIDAGRAQPEHAAA